MEDLMERCSERSTKENVKGKLKLFWGWGEGLGKIRGSFYLPLLFLGTTRFPTLENRIQTTIIVVFSNNLIAFFMLASLKSSHHNIVHIQ